MLFKIKNIYIVGLASWLQELRLNGTSSRIRTRFINVLSERAQENEKFRLEMLNKLAEKDSKGQFKIKNDTYVLSDKNSKKFNDEFKVLMDEEFKFTIDSALKNDYSLLATIVIHTDYLFGPKQDDSKEEKVAKTRQMVDYEQWCKSFEPLQLHGKKHT